MNRPQKPLILKPVFGLLDYPKVRENLFGRDPKISERVFAGYKLGIVVPEDLPEAAKEGLSPEFKGLVVLIHTGNEQDRVRMPIVALTSEENVILREFNFGTDVFESTIIRGKISNDTFAHSLEIDTVKGGIRISQEINGLLEHPFLEENKEGLYVFARSLSEKHMPPSPEGNRPSTKER